MISIIIPVYKNSDLFLKNFEHNYPYLKNHQIIIVNDDPETHLDNKLSPYKNILLINNSKNVGFGDSINQGAKKATGNYLMLLNSDVIINDMSYLNALDSFKKEGVFAVSFTQIEKDGSTVGKNIIFWDNGIIAHKRANRIASGINAWAEGGSCLIDKNKFNRLGGFDSLYSPFYWEDIDLSYRAWKSGYQILFLADVLVTHHHESTINKYFSGQYIKTIASRNQLIFIWKNITDGQLLLNHLFFLLPWLIKSLIKGNYFVINAFFKALIVFPIILITKIRIKRTFVVSDNKILSLFK